jgi:hypothetical protein
MATRRHQHNHVNFAGAHRQVRPFRMKTVVVALFFVVAGLVALLVSIELDEKSHPVAKSLLREFATISIIGGTLHVTYELFQRIEYVRATEEHTETVLESLERTSRAIFDHLSLAEETLKMGLAAIHPDASNYDYAPMIEHAATLTIVLNDGRTWVSNNAGRLRKRLADPSRKTRFFFLHPQSPMQMVLARKYGSSETALAAKLNETLMMLADVAPPEANLEVFAHNLFNPHSVFIADSHAIISPYFHSRTRRTVPALRFQDTDEGCFFREIREDIDALMLDAETLAIPWSPPQ